LMVIATMPACVLTEMIIAASSIESRIGVAKILMVCSFFVSQK